MSHGTVSDHSGEKIFLRKFWLILISLVFVSINIYAQNSWKRVSSIVHSRSGATASVVNDKIYVIGGYYNINFSYNEMYDPSTNTWELKASMPTARGFLSSVVLDGIIYVIGGGYPTWTRKVEVYDPVSNTWTTKKDMIVARINGRAAVVDGKIYVIAGAYTERTCEVYDPNTDTWTKFSDFPDASGGVSSIAVYNGLIYAFGGGYYNGLRTVYAYDPKADTWTRMHDIWTPRTVSQVCVVNDQIYLIGGAVSEFAPTAAVEMYDPDTDTWWIKSNMPAASAFLSCAVVNDKIYVFEGTPDWSTGGSKVWEYDPSSDPVTLPTPVELTSCTASSNGKEVTLNWTTATELNNQGFEVQRKFGSNDFITVGSAKGHGTTTSPNQYSYVDKLVDPGKYFYRLKQINYSGTFEYSDEIEVVVRVLDKFTLEQNYPNPFNPTTTIGYVLQEKGNTKLTLLNALGEELAILVNEDQEKGFHKVEINGSNLTSGVYFYQLHAGSFIETKKMILMR